jgi:pro-kumamolisin-like protein/Big-like domain-containing protein/outer membrane protein with beta-barrel domain
MSSDDTVNRSPRQSAFARSLSVLAGLAVALAMGIAADYGIGTASAAISNPSDAQASSDVPAPSPVAVTDSPTADSRGDQAIGPEPGNGLVRLPGHVLDAMAKAELVAAAPGQVDRQSLTLTLTLKRDDQAGFDRYFNDVYDPHSKNFRHFLTQAQITKKFGPSQQGYSQVLAYLRTQGFSLIQGSKNRMTLTVRGSRASTEQAFALHIGNYKIGDNSFYANDSDPALPQKLASRVLAINGLSTLSKPKHVLNQINTYCGKYTVGAAANKTCKQNGAAALNLILVLDCLSKYLFEAFGGVPGKAVSNVLTAICSGAALAKAAGPFVHTAAAHASTGSAKRTLGTGRSRPEVADGTGQTIGLVEFDGFNTSDVSDYLTLIGAPAAISNLSAVPVNGGVASPGSGEGEVLLDIDTVMSLAPNAKVVVYDAPFSGQATSYTQVLNAMINGGVTVISNSWASCENQVSQAEAQSIDAVLQAAAAAGIAVFNGTGDTGSTCIDGSPNTVAVPADSPNATAVGGSSLLLGPGGTYGSEQWWDGSSDVPPTGQGGFGVSKFFVRPSYQAAVNGASMRSVPDVVTEADPAVGVLICQADNGGCPNGSYYGGTSLAAPEWAALAALINQAQGKSLGSFNQLLYPLAGTDAFHGAASMGSDFQHVGLGSPNLNVMNRLLSGQQVGTPDAAVSQVSPMLQPVTATFQANGSFAVPADGASQGGVLVTLLDSNGNTVSGKTVTLVASGGSATITPASAVTTVSNGAVAFTVTDLTTEALTFTATDTTDGVVLPAVSLTFGVPPASSAGISANPPSVAADGATAATIIVTLKDSLNRPTPGKTIAVSDAGAHAVITGPTPAVTDANGQIQFLATDQVDETVTFTATDVTDGSLPVPGSPTVDFSGSTSTACGVGIAPVAGTGYTITPYVTGFPAAATLFYGNANLGCPGANNPAFTSSGTVLVSDFLTGGIYQVGLSGGAVSSTNVLGTLTPALGGLVYGKDGSVYATLGGEAGEIVQVNPTTGTLLRVVASGVTCPGGLTVDPLSGDLFFDDQCTGGGADNASIFRVIDPANTDSSRPTSVVVYAMLPTTPNGNMAFAPNGTLYAVSGYFKSQTAQVEAVSGTNSATVSVSPVSGVTSDYAVAIGATNTDGSAQSLIVEPAGTLSEIPIATPSTVVVLGTGSPGVGVTGPDGCLYSEHYDTIYRLANSTGNCTFAPTSPAPSIRLTPAVVSPNPAQGSSQTLTATVHNVSPLAGVPVYFFVAGANPQAQLVKTDSSGNAALSYTALQPGSDTVIATTGAGNTALTSNGVLLNWTAGQHVTFLGLNSSPQGATLNQAVSVAAALADLSAGTPAMLAGQPITFTLGGQTCTATTGSTGIATCSLTPTQTGIGTLSASFPGNGQYAASTNFVGFTVPGAAAAAPTVTLSVSPTTVAAGSPATITWSSTNTTACAASGSWSGSRPTSGTQSVTPTMNGAFVYVLSCTGASGTVAASATLSASLVAITVIAKSGGGAFGWNLLTALGLLVMLRFRAVLARRGPAAASRGPGRSLVAITLVGALLAIAGMPSARADQSTLAMNQPSSWFDPLYMGVRVGSMPVHLNSSTLDQRLTASGYSGIDASTDTSTTGGTVYIGYELNPIAGIEFGYTRRSSTVATLSGTLASTADITPLLQNTTELIRGYGNIFSLSFRGRFELVPRFSIDPRVGAFFWDTKVTAESGAASVDTTHRGGGVTAGVGVAYRVWHGLELGLGVDYFRGSPNNVALLYGGSLEWRFGHNGN